MEQLSHLDHEKKHHSLSIIVICDRLQSTANLGSICRISEAFGALKLFVHKDNESFLDRPRFKKVSRHSFKNLDICYYENVNKLLDDLQSEEFQLVCIEKCDKSEMLQTLEFHKKTCFIVGHEITGVNQNFLDRSDSVAHIDMFGNNSSINVSQSLAIALYEFVRQKI